MPTIGWIDALRTYNAGMPSWCVPRKGTPGYERVMRIRQGEQTKGFKEVLEDLERKTGGKPKKEKTSMAIDLGTQSANVPTIPAGPPKTEVSTKKSSGSNNKKKMAVVPVNYVAEGVAEGSPKKQSMKEKIKEAKKLGASEAARKKKALDTDVGKKLTQDLAELETELKSYTNELARLHRKLGGPSDDADETKRYAALKSTLIPGQKKKVNAIKEQLEALVEESAEGGAKEANWTDIRWWKDDEFRIFHMDGKLYPGKVYQFRTIIDPKPSSSVGHTIRAMEDGSVPPRVKRDKLTPLDESSPQDKAFLKLAKELLARGKNGYGADPTADETDRIKEILKMTGKTLVDSSNVEAQLLALRTEQKEKTKRLNTLLKGKQDESNREERHSLLKRLAELPKEIASVRKQLPKKKA